LAEPSVIALVGGSTLLGRELRDVLAYAQPDTRVKLVAAEGEEAGTLTEHAGEAAVITDLDEESLRSARAVLLAASPDLSRKVLAMNVQGAVIDLTYAVEDDPRARLRAPLVEPSGFESGGNVHEIAHPAAIALALFFNHLHLRYPVRRSVVHIFEPASERGGAGVDELQQQTVSLLSFKGLPKAIFDAQLSFTMLARYGEEAATSLEDIELRVERHLASLLANSSRAPMPSLRLVQVPVFHGYSFSLWLDFEDNPGVDAIEKTLTAAGVDVRGEGMEPPNNVGMAGQSGIAVGAVTLDRNCTSACWVWMVADNLRISADNAAAVAAEAS
jgi:aspartate-semialdehyde dehydrogenase